MNPYLAYCHYTLKETFFKTDATDRKSPCFWFNVFLFVKNSWRGGISYFKKDLESRLSFFKFFGKMRVGGFSRAREKGPYREREKWLVKVYESVDNLREF